MSPLRRIVFLITLFFLVSSMARAGETVAEHIERQDVDQIEYLLADGNCRAAVAAINTGVAAKKPHIMQLAGAMYEDGLCVKQDWDKAVSFYMRAEEAGNRFAIGRLIAGYARPGRDNSMALYWAARSEQHGAYPPSCIPVANPVSDQEGFIAGLERMPPATFQGCVYLVGVVSEIVSQVRYPRLALLNGISGQYTMRFVPATGTVTWTIDEFDMSGNGGSVRFLTSAEQNSPHVIRNSLLNYLQGKSNFALARYTRSGDSFGPDYAFKFRFVFNITH
jgi:hypothetical protein